MGINQRQSKVEWFEKIFAVAKQKDKILDTKKTIAMYCLENQSTERTAKEILNIFQNSEQILIGTDGIVVIK